tara:strand:- start:113 stop:1219 length:1107 start_codon:yes stop_codon:yes gene_type:complete
MIYLITFLFTFNVTNLYAQAIDINFKFEKSVFDSENNFNTVSSTDIWTGAEITISRTNNSEQVFDTLTSSIIITRGSDGLLYNSATEDAANQQSPEGMLWYEGVLENFNEDELKNLNYVSLREVTNQRMKDVAGKSFIVSLPEDDIFFELTFNDWQTRHQGAGYSYTRTSPSIVVKPNKISLISPDSSATDVELVPTFVWVSDSLASHYQFELTNLSDSSMIDTLVAYLSYTSGIQLTNSTTYTWRIRGLVKDQNLYGEWSSRWIFTTESTSSSTEDEFIPNQFTLVQNYPNPFNPSTQIQYALPEATQVTLEVFNSVGQKVMDLVNRQQSAGYHTTTFDASGLSSGVYLYKLTTPSFTKTKKMLLIK